MLSELHIENLGVIRGIDLVVAGGLTAITGETGAGKTMLVEALDLVVGGRADPLIVRPGTAEARIDARFVNDDGDEVVLSRVVPAEGRSRAYVDGRPATAAALANVATNLVDLHGQHAHQRLLSPATQRAALDAFGGIDLDRVAARRGREWPSSMPSWPCSEVTTEHGHANWIWPASSWPSWKQRPSTIPTRTPASRCSRTRWPAPSSIAPPGHRRTTRSRATGALATPSHPPPPPWPDGRRTGPWPTASPMSSPNSTTSALQFATRRNRSPTIHNGWRRSRARRQLLHDLCRKYGDTLAEVQRFHREVAERVDTLERYDERAAMIDAERRAAVAAADAEAAAVLDARREAAPGFAAAVTERLRALAMPDAVLDVTVEDLDAVQFVLSANPGMPLLPLSKVASGGELARTMLALRLVMIGHERDPDARSTLIFDEVDAGIGGAAATAVGEALAAVAESHQVLVVTHLAQVAAAAHNQIAVTKAVSDAETTATAEPVVGDRRVAEVARMLSGGGGGIAAEQHAAELLAR